MISITNSNHGNYLPKFRSGIKAIARRISEYVDLNCDDVDEGFEIAYDRYLVFVEYRYTSEGGAVTVADVWDKDGNEYPDVAEALQLLID